jgi:PIN domain nuclease of toxin-antitoxin system
MERAGLTLLLDTHAVYWWSASSTQLSLAALKAISEADRLAVAAPSWYELAWLVVRERIHVNLPLRSWLRELAEEFETFAVTPSIAATAAELPVSFPSDPADRLIYATAIEHGLRLVTKDQGLRGYRYSREVTLW